MADPFRRYPDGAKTIAKILEQFVPPVAKGSRVGTRFPSDLTGLLPFIRVVRQGGTDDGVSDYPILYITVLSASISEGETLSERIRQKLTTEKLRLGSIVVDRVKCDAGAVELEPWAPGISRFEAQYTAVFRRYSAPA
jgi:hypothetical protein